MAFIKKLIDLKVLKCFFRILLFIPVGAFTLFGDDDTEGDGSWDNPKVIIDTCGTLSGNLITYKISSIHTVGPKGYETFMEERSIDMRIISKDFESPETTVVNLLSWNCSTDGFGPEKPPPVTVKVRKDEVKLFYDTTIVSHFVYKKGVFDLAPEFRSRIIKGLHKNDRTIYCYDLYDILTGSQWEDKHIVQILRLYLIRDSLRIGMVDAMIKSLQELAQDAANDTILRYCKELSDSLIFKKKENQPATLADAKKTGIILSPPVYPPLDSPTVFWRDTLLCVIQENPGQPLIMRTFNPFTGKWGPKIPAKYPESGMSQLFEKNTGFYSIACPDLIVCWHKMLGEFNDDPCDGLDCSPLIKLNDPTSGSVENYDDLVKAGGSCAANNGALEFRDGGELYFMGDTNQSWMIFPDELRYGSRDYPFELKRSYPVVVSPNQQWVAYATNAKGGKSIELWVGRLKYKN